MFPYSLWASIYEAKKIIESRKNFTPLYMYGSDIEIMRKLRVGNVIKLASPRLTIKNSIF